MATGALLVLLFLVLSANAYFGVSLLDRLKVFGQTSEPAPVASGRRVYYSRTDTVAPGMPGFGSRGQDRPLQPGDVVLLGGSGRLVRLDKDSVTELPADAGTTVVVQNLGPWDAAGGRLAGQSARLVDGRWVVEQPALGGIFPTGGLRDDELPKGFALVPNPAISQSRVMETRDGTAVRIRAVDPNPFAGLQAHAIPDVPEGAAVTVWALVRAREDTTVGMTLTDVVGADGSSEQATARWPGPKNWTRVVLQKRLAFRAPEDRFSLGLIDARAGDWLEVRDVGVFVGALP